MANNKKKYTKGELLLKTICFGSPDEATQLLKEKTGQSAENNNDLEYKLAQMYIKATDKKDIEKRLAEIHPHRNLITRYLAPKIENTPMEQPSMDKHIEEVQKMASAEGEVAADIFGKATADHLAYLHAPKDHTPMVLGVMGIFAIVATLSIALLLSKKIN